MVCKSACMADLETALRRPWRVMHKPVKYVEKGLTYAARGAWVVFDALNSIRPNEGFVKVVFGP